MSGPYQRYAANPGARGLYAPEFEHDSCGVAFVATLRGTPGRDVIDATLTALANLDHRGAVGAEVDTGDGAGLLTQVPDAFLRDVAFADLPAAGAYGVGMAFLPVPSDERTAAKSAFEALAREESLAVLAWREVPIRPDIVGATARECMPAFEHVFVADPSGNLTGMELERRCYRLAKRALLEAEIYFPSLSSRTLVYKGMLTTGQLAEFFPDLADSRFASELGIAHARFSTNTFPSWPLAQPFSMVAHNGEINTVRGNRNWIAAREGLFDSPGLGDISQITPVCAPGESDSASFNSVLELLHFAGRSLPHAILMMVPEAWENHSTMDPARRSFYEYHSTLMEPWDGPACLAFTDGRLVGAVLDRNGLRPGRYWVTADGLVVLASEAGVLDIDPSEIVEKGRLEPGKMFLVDTGAGRIIPDAEIKRDLAIAQPYGQWVAEHAIHLADLPDREHIAHSPSSVVRRQLTFGYTTEELSQILSPMARTGAEPIGAMGSDTPIAVLSGRPRLLFDYFSQLFAQVTNPPLDAIREELVTSLAGAIGPEPNLLEGGPEHARKLMLPFPVIDNDQLAKITHVSRYRERAHGFSALVVRALYPVGGGGPALEARLAEICAQVDAAIEEGTSFIVLSDRESSAELAPIPSLLVLSAVHHHLIRRHTRTRVSLIVEAGDVREVHHVALLVGYGAACVNPYLAMESAEQLVRLGDITEVSAKAAVANLIKALGKGVLKVMSKMGISTVNSYRGAQVFEAVGLASDLVERYFTGTSSRLGGVGLDVLAAEVAARHEQAYPRVPSPGAPRELSSGGQYKWRRDGEEHLFDPETIFTLQHATRTKSLDVFRRYSARVDDQSARLLTLRGLLRLRTDAVTPVPLEEVEDAASIVRRFATGAMSYGSISREAHETLAIAMNSLGAKSNTGEGGEDPERLADPTRNSKIKQVASARFGVTSQYLASAEDIQIKIAQGAKPGEGGQLPGTKVYPWVARTRHATPGVGLISPPPHHDIYSIEDLAQLIHDLKNANRDARIHVKLVAEIGVGTIAAGVAKAHSDVILISGHDGGTGASPLTSLKHAGAPWELGLAETQQTLVLNNLRDRVVVQVDGQLRTGRDVVIAALLGAEEFGFATAPLVVAGCVMMRVCHQDTCPVGIATQNPELRARFTGQAEHVANFMLFVAEEVRELLAQLGLRSLDEAIGRADLLDSREAVAHWKAAGLDLAPILDYPPLAKGAARRQVRAQDHGLGAALDNDLIAAATPALDTGARAELAFPVRNIHRCVGTMLGHEVTKRFAGAGLPDDTIEVTLTGSAGQSLGAFLPAGVTLRLFGDANDYAGKGLSGGRIVVRPDRSATFPAEHQVIAGNVLCYGATGGEFFARGVVGERFAVRNSGAVAIVEGVGDHGCEYMTGGRVVVLGPTGRNFAAGMSGGVAYVLDLNPGLVTQGALASRELLASALDVADGEWLLELLTRYVKETDSPVAAAILADTAAGLARFTKLVPAQYARMQAAMDHVAAEGIDPYAPASWERVLEVAHG